MKKINIKIKFTDKDVAKRDEELPGVSGRKILKALEKAKVKVTTFRYTYVESQHGTAEMPPALILACFLTDLRDCQGWSHILPSLSGEYTFTFRPFKR